MVKNQSDVVSQIATRVVNTTPPTTGSDQEGVLCERTKVTWRQGAIEDAAQNRGGEATQFGEVGFESRAQRQ